MFTRILSAVAALFVLLLALAATPAEARWLRAESPRFIIYSDGSESVLRAYVDKMEVFDTFLRARHGLPENGVPLRKLPIYLVRSRTDLQITWNGAGDAVAGYYSPGSGDTFAVVTLEDRKDSTVLMHEYTHHFMLQNFPGAYPAWMVEGYAEFYGETKVNDRFIEVGQVANHRADALLAGRWMPMADLLGNKRTSTDWNSFYGQSWILTHYLMSDPARFTQFRTYASAVGRGADPVKAMEAATGQSPEALEQTLRKYVRSGLKITQYKRGNIPQPQITVTTLPPSADDLLLQRIQIVAHSYKDADPGYLAMIRKRAAKYPDDQLAVLTLGQTEMELGDHAAGRSLLEGWLRTHPDDAEAMFVLGSHLYNDAWSKSDEAADKKDAAGKKGDDDEDVDEEPVERTVADPEMMKDAERWLAKAVELAPTDYRILYAYAQTRRQSGGYPQKSDLDLLIRAYKQAPQVVPLRFELIQVLIVQNHTPEARALLQPLLNSPHGGSVVAAAQRLLQRIEDQERRKGAG